MGERELAQERSNVVKHFSNLHEMYTIVTAEKNVDQMISICVMEVKQNTK